MGCPRLDPVALGRCLRPRGGRETPGGGGVLGGAKRPWPGASAWWQARIQDADHQIGCFHNLSRLFFDGFEIFTRHVSTWVSMNPLVGFSTGLPFEGTRKTCEEQFRHL